MNPSIIHSANKPSSPSTTTLLPPHFICNPIPHRLCKTHFRRHRYRISVARSSSQSPDASAAVVKPDVFGDKRELTAIESLVEAMSPPVRIASSALVFTAAVAGGYGLGFMVGGFRNSGIGGAVILGAAGAGAAFALNSCVPEVAAASLHNYVVGCDDLGALKKEDIEAMANKYGVSTQHVEFNAKLCDIYCRL